LHSAGELCAYGFGYLYVDRGEPVVAVGLEAVDDGEELFMQSAGDRAHGAVAYEDAVDRAEVSNLGGGAGEEGLVSDIEHLAGQRLFDHFDAELLGQRDDRGAGDAAEHRVGQRCGVEDAALDQKEVFAGAFGEIAVDVKPDALGVAVDLGLHANELRVHVVGAGLGERGHRVGREPVPTGDADVGAGIAGDVFAPWEVGDIDLDGGLERIDTDLAVASKCDGADVAGSDAVGFDHIDDRAHELVRGVGQGHAVDLGGGEQSLHMLLQAEDASAIRLRITADAFKDRRPVVDDVGHDVDLGFVPGNEISVVPDVVGGLKGHAIRS